MHLHLRKVKYVKTSIKQIKEILTTKKKKLRNNFNGTTKVELLMSRLIFGQIKVKYFSI